MILLLVFILYAIVLSGALAWAGHPSRSASTSGIPGVRFTKVLVIGATGGSGRQLITQALERGYAVTALARKPWKIQLDHPRLTILQGDVSQKESLEAAMRGQEAVLCALGHKRFFYPTRILSAGIQYILHAMKSHFCPTPRL